MGDQHDTSLGKLTAPLSAQERERMGTTDVGEGGGNGDDDKS
jgi:hypothetical protein